MECKKNQRKRPGRPRFFFLIIIKKQNLKYFGYVVRHNNIEKLCKEVAAWEKEQPEDDGTRYLRPVESFNTTGEPYGAGRSQFLCSGILIIIKKQNLKYFGHVVRHNNIEKLCKEVAAWEKENSQKMMAPDISDQLKVSTRQASLMAQDAVNFCAAVW
ncbi:hypothetical protein PoB_003074400 [Plakobranchus ocellatus]|uniref:Uncharacterized protein n=1 Tax=Plakobranchus ocellatus TaxID=259542 RepID=A0AAV4ACV1_9GAST|nr:hypothetical protein PoB_003074400 [Plakobranchus ocellatus]